MTIDINYLKLNFSDLMNIVRKFKYNILSLSLCFGLIGGLYALIKRPEYNAEASFREKNKSYIESSHNLNLALILGGSEKNENSAVSLMKSRTILQEVISQQGLQAEITQKGFFKNLFRNLKENVLTETAYFIPNYYPIFPSSLLSLQSITYEGEIPLKLRLQFISENEFIIFDSTYSEIGKSLIGRKYNSELCSFTISENLPQLSLHRTQWDLTFLPMTMAVEKLQKRLKVQTDSFDKSLLLLSYNDSDRRRASAFLNSLMKEYVDYLKSEHVLLAADQLSYLRSRQREIAADLKQIMEEHAQAVSSNTTSIESLALLQEGYTQRALLIELELIRLKKALEIGVVYYDQYPNGTDSSVINKLLTEIRSCKEQSDALQVAMEQFAKKETSSFSISEQMNNLEEIRINSNEAKKILASLDLKKGGFLENNGIVFKKHPLNTWFLHLEKVNSQGDLKKSEEYYQNFKIYLENLLHQWDLEEKLILERLTHSQAKPLEFQGIDLLTANQLYVDYSKNLNEIEANILHYQFILNQMQDPLFELSSLSSVLNDQASQNIIHKAVELDLHKLDETNRSQKEIERIREDLSFQRKYLLLHVEQVTQLFKIKQQLFQDKIQALHYSRLELINQRISVLNQQLSDYIKNRIENFQQDKISLDQQQQFLKKQMKELPNKWASEKLLDLHLEMSSKMVEEITKLVESKNISSHIDTTQSSPLDLSIPGPIPSNPHFVLFSVVGMLLGGTLSLGFFLTKSIVKNIPPTESLLKQLNFPVLGHFSKIDQEVLYRLLDWVNKQPKGANSGQSVFLIHNHRFDYSDKLAHLISKRGLKTLLLTLVMERKKNIDSEYRNENSINDSQIKPRNLYDYLLLNICSEDESLELISDAFKNQIDVFKEKYDCVLISSNLSPCTYTAENIIKFCDCSIITLREESMQDLIASFKELPKKPLFILLE